MTKTTTSSFPQRSLNSLLDCLKKGQCRLDLLKNVLKYKVSLDVSGFIPFLSSKSEFERKLAIEIIVNFGDKNLLIDYLKLEKKQQNILHALDLFLKNKDFYKDKLEDISFLMVSPWDLIQEKCISVFRNFQREDLLFPLVFNEDTKLGDRVRNFIDESKISKDDKKE